jgi:hypothetical protein
MRKHSAFLLLTILVVAVFATAQEKTASQPAASAQCKFADGKIRLTIRSSAKSRQIFGRLVPYEQVGGLAPARQPRL